MKKEIRRIVIISPTRGSCEVVRNIFTSGPIQTFLQTQFPDKMADLAKLEKTFGIVAGTGVGKTVFIRDICRARFGESFAYSVVTREEEATPKTWQSQVLIVTTGIAMNYLKAGHITNEDWVIIDEIHQTSTHLELAMALAKYNVVSVSWMSATINPAVYRDYFDTKEVFECQIRDPDKRAQIQVYKLDYRRHPPGAHEAENEIFVRDSPVKDFLRRKHPLQQIIERQEGVLIFLPTRAMCEEHARAYNDASGLHVDFYHGGESASKLGAYLRGEIPKPFLVFMTAAGSSALNVKDLAGVVILDEVYHERIVNNVKTLQREFLGNNDLLQMAGRIDGRVKDGWVAFLTTRPIDYENLRPVDPQFVLGGDLEDVALTCANLGISLNELDPIGHIGHAEFNAVWNKLVARGLISPDNRLTDYGRQVSQYPVSRVWGEHLAQCDDDLLPFVVVASASPSLYNMVRHDDDYDIKEFIVIGNDFLTKYNIIRHVIEKFTRVVTERDTGAQRFQLIGNFYQWTKGKGLYPKPIEQVLIAVASVCRSLEIPLRAVGGKFPEITPEDIIAFKQLILQVGALEVRNSAHVTIDGYSTKNSAASVCSSVSGNVLFGESTAFMGKNGLEKSMEGVTFNFAELEPYVEAVKRKIEYVRVSMDCEGVIVRYAYPGLGFSTLVQTEVEYEELPADALHQAQISLAVQSFARRLASDLPDGDLLPEEITTHNKAIIEAIVAYRQKQHKIDYGPWAYCYGSSPDTIAEKIYQGMLESTGVHTLPMAQKAGINFRISESFVPTEPLIEQPEPMPTSVRPAERFGTNLGSVLRRQIQSGPPANTPLTIRHLNGKPPRPDPTIGKATLTGIAPMKTKAELRREREQKEREDLKAQQAAAAAAIPQGKTRTRVHWLENQADQLRAELEMNARKLAEQQQRADELGAIYDEAYRAKGNGTVAKAQSEWTAACRLVDACREQNAAKKTKLTSKIDALESEALEIMMSFE